MRKLILFLLISYISLSASDFQGTVYIDENSNGVMDSLEKGIFGISVSDGINVIKTNQEGKFSLPGTGKTKFIFITTPSGYQPVKKFYIPVEESERPYNFGLKKTPLPARESIRFIQITDTETFEDKGWIQPIREYGENENVSFLIHTGDICYEKGLNFHKNNLNRETMGLPVYCCIGNHDLVDGDYGEQLYESLFGPVYYSFNVGNYHFVVTPMLGGDYQPSYTKKDVYLWLKNDLQCMEDSKKIIIFNHDLLTFEDEFIYGISSEEQVHLNDYGLKAWIYGHWHMNYLRKHGNSGIISVCSSPPDKGGIDHSSSNFLVYEINEQDSIIIHPRYNYLKNHFGIISPNGNQVLLNKEGQLTVSVNFYHTSSPALYLECHFSGDKNPKRLKQNSDWNWSIEYPLSDLSIEEAGKLIIRAVLKNGDIASTVKSFSLPDNRLEAINLLETIQEMAGKEEMNLVWTHNTGGNIWMSSPVYSDGKLLIASMDEFGKKKQSISALCAETGNLAWRFKTDASIKNDICSEDGKVFAVDEDGTAYGIDIQNGNLLWKKELGMDSPGSCVSGSSVNEGIFYGGFGNYLSAIDTKDGTLLWKNQDWNGGEGTVSSHMVAGNTLITGSNWRSLYGHDKHTGKMKWEQSGEGLRFRSSTPVYVSDTLFVCAQRALIKMDPESGHIFQVFPVPYDLQTAASPIVTEKLFILGTSGGGLSAFDRKDMKEIWNVKTGPSLIYTAPYSKPYSSTVESSPVCLGNSIVFGASDGFLYFVDCESGQVIQKIEIGAPILADILVLGDKIYAADFSGNISCFQIQHE